MKQDNETKATPQTEPFTVKVVATITMEVNPQWYPPESGIVTKEQMIADTARAFDGRDVWIGDVFDKHPTINVFEVLPEEDQPF